MEKRHSVESNESKAKKIIASKKAKLSAALPKLLVSEIPNEELQDILIRVSDDGMKKLRYVSKRFRETIDAFVMRNFLHSMRCYNAEDSKSEMAIITKVTNLGIELYVGCGYRSTTVAMLLDLQLPGFSVPFVPNYIKLKPLMLTYFSTLDTYAKLHSQQFQLLFILTLIRILKAFKCTEMKNDIKGGKRRISMEIIGPWIGCMSVLIRRTRVPIENKYILLSIFMELLISDNAGVHTKRVWQVDNICFLYGYVPNSNNGRFTPSTTFIFTFDGSQQICELIEKCLLENTDPALSFEWPKRWTLAHDFTFSMAIHSKETARWGCASVSAMSFKPNRML